MSNGLKDALTEGYTIDIQNTTGLKQKTIGRKKLVAKIDNIIKAHEMNMKTNIAKKQLNEGTKFDSGKIPLELIPTAAVEEIAKVLAFGAKKYDSWNWAKGMAWSRLIGASLRHIFAYARGIDKDPETGLSHLAHAGCCILFLLQYDLSKLGNDDRYKEFKDGI